MANCLLCARGVMVDTAANHVVYDWRGDTHERPPCTNPIHVNRAIDALEQKIEWWRQDTAVAERDLIELRARLTP